MYYVRNKNTGSLWFGPSFYEACLEFLDDEPVGLRTEVEIVSAESLQHHNDGE